MKPAARRRRSKEVVRLAVSVRAASAKFAREKAPAGMFGALLAQLRTHLGEDYSVERAADDFGQSVAALAVMRNVFRHLSSAEWNDVVALAGRHPVCRLLWDAVNDGAARGKHSAHGEIVQAAQQCEVNGDPIAVGQLLEELLQHADPQRRRTTGVYFTPPAIAQYLVRRTDDVLRQEFSLAGGLASRSPLRIIDPAMGGGVFPLEIIRHLRQSLSAEWAAEDASESSIRRRWSDYVSQQLLPRLVAFEIMPAPLVLAHFLIAAELVASGYTPAANDRLNFHLCDTLGAPRQLCAPGELAIVIGNPPYRSASAGGHDWIVRLMHGQAESGRACASYYRVDGAPLAERKHWLHDDYVKFFRWAQWQVECAAGGVVALVTNHGFLDNPTFRGMRCGLLDTFANIELVDLHGNTKKGADEKDESVFATAQGMATTVAWKAADAGGRGEVRRGNLFGRREEKLQRLSDGTIALELEPIHPAAPYYFFVAHDGLRAEEYARGHSIAEIMPVNTTAVVTARDSLVIDIDRDELERRLATFRDLRIADDEIRARFFKTAQTTRYPPGDTRGWKLAEARRRLAAEPNWQSRIRTCLYRPFDRRWIYWAPWMIDWPRQQVMRHLQPGNVALVCRRQMLRGRPCNFFFVADDIVIDGYIRSDNRGSESVFPLHLLADEGSLWPQRRANFTDAFVAAIGSRLGAEFAENDQRRDNTFTAHDVLHYIYAVFHSTSYRTRYAEQLCIEFPRVPAPCSAEMFRRLAACGERLVRWHVLRGEEMLEGDVEPPPAPFCHGGEILARLPMHRDQHVHLSPECAIGPISAAAWEFRVGAHQVLRKWLKDRRGRMLNREDVQIYERIAAAAKGTLGVMGEIESVVERAGGWAGCFRPAR